MDLAFAKDVLGNQGTISFNVISDVLNFRERQSLTETPFFTSDSEFQWRERQMTLSFVYRINQKKAKNGNQQQRGGDDEGEY